MLLQVSLRTGADDTCGGKKIDLNQYIHKSTYTVAIHAVTALKAAYRDTHKVFGEYLTATAGQKFNPPIQFNVVSNYFAGLFDAIDNEELDFFLTNQGIYSCIGTQVGATALATVVKDLSVRGRAFELDVYGGVIAVRADNDAINTIVDLRDKIIGAGAIVDLMGAQLEIYEMGRDGGMSYVNDPRQVSFTKYQVDVVRGVLSGRFDVGFLRTNQIEPTTDENGEPIDPDLFKIIDPKVYVMDNGDLFPFLHSTDIYPEWPLAALSNVPDDVQLAVQEALFDFEAHAMIGNMINGCLAANTTHMQNCYALNPQDLIANAPCDASQDIALLAAEAGQDSHIFGF